MKHYMSNFKISLLLMTFMASFLFGVTSCKESDSSGGTPKITSVTNTDPNNQITYDKIGAGSLIVIRGENLGGTQKVYINDQEVWFNTTMNTDHSIIVQIPTEDDGFVLTAFDSNLKDEIRVVTSDGIATYTFKITAPYPSATSVISKFPRNAGDWVTVIGQNLVDIDRIFITSLTTDEIYASSATEIGGTQAEVTEYEITKQEHRKADSGKGYVTDSEMKFKIPEMSFDGGTLVIECAAGNVLYPFILGLAPPEILKVNTAMPIAVEELIITGKNFVQVDEIKIGDKVVNAEDFEVDEASEIISITFKEYMKPSTDATPQLSVKTGGGVVTTGFYNYSTIIYGFEDGQATNNGWGGDPSYETTDGSTAPFTCDGNFAHYNIPAEGQQWWGTMIYYRKDWSGNSFPLPGFDVIPADAPAEKIYLAMEVYNIGSDYNKFDAEGVPTFTGYLRYMIQPLDDSENTYDNFKDWVPDGYPTKPVFETKILADADGNAYEGKWYRHVLPLSKFNCYAGKTYSEIVTTGLNQFRIQSINQGTVVGKIDFCLDNIRIIYIP